MKLEDYKRYKYDELVKDINYLRDYIWVNYYRINKDDVRHSEMFNRVLNTISNKYTDIIEDCKTLKEVDILYKVCHKDILVFKDLVKMYTKNYTPKDESNMDYIPIQ